MGHLKKAPWLGADKPTCDDESLMSSLRQAMANVSSAGDDAGDDPGYVHGTRIRTHPYTPRFPRHPSRHPIPPLKTPHHTRT